MDSRLEEYINEGGIKIFDKLERLNDTLESIDDNLEKIADALETLADCTAVGIKGRTFCISGSIYKTEG